MAVKWVRVKDKRTGHEYSVNERAVKDDHEVLDKPAVGRNGKPLPAKPKVKVKVTSSSGGGEEMPTTVPELQKAAKAAGVEGISGMNKDQLTAALKEANR